MTHAFGHVFDRRTPLGHSSQLAPRPHKSEIGVPKHHVISLHYTIEWNAMILGTPVDIVLQQFRALITPVALFRQMP